MKIYLLPLPGKTQWLRGREILKAQQEEVITHLNFVLTYRNENCLHSFHLFKYTNDFLLLFLFTVVYRSFLIFEFR